MTGVDPLLVAGGVWLWQSYGKDVFSWLVKHLAAEIDDLKDAGWEKIDWAMASGRYRKELSKLYGRMHIFGMSKPVPIGDIFTDVYLLDKPSAWQRHAIEELQARSQEQRESLLRKQRRNGVAVVRNQKRLYILGQPGSGKTTFLKYLVMEAVAGRLEAIPIFVSLKVWSDANIDLFAFLVRQFAICSFPNAYPFIKQILEDGKAMVLFDGLDEVNLEGGARARITTAVRDFADQYGKSKVVITCRTAATEYVFERFNYCELAEFTQEQMAGFINRWFQANEAKRQAFWEAFSQPEQDRLHDLGRRPLLLTMLCLTFEETMSFPLRKAELYEEAIDALLKKWDSSRSIQRDAVYRKLSLGYKRQLLMEIAAETFQRGELFMRKRDLAWCVISFLRRLPPTDSSEDIDGDAVLQSIEAQHGLLIERAHDVYSFSHLSFHEYFAARYIAEHPEPSVLYGVVSHGSDPGWREVLSLTASLLDYRNVARLFDCWCDHLERNDLARGGLEAFIHWADDVSAAAGHPRNIQAHAAVMRAALLDWVSIQAANLARDLAGIRDLASTLGSDLASDLASASTSARDLASALTRVHALDRTCARTIALANDLDRVRSSELDRARELSSELDCARELASELASAGDDDRDRDGDRARHLVSAIDSARRLADHNARDRRLDRDRNSERAHQLVHAIATDRRPELSSAVEQARELAHASVVESEAALDDALALVRASALALVRASASARTLSQIYAVAPHAQANEMFDTAYIRSSRQVEHISPALLDPLDRYLASTRYLLDCLRVAVVENRDAILRRLLRPPVQPKATDTAQQQ